jgi:hypothetical protein
MRSTAELIAELEQEAQQHWYVTMVVGFENSTIFVQTKDENRLAMLNTAILAGGIPVGLIAVDKTKNELVLLTRVYPEHQDWEGADGYLTSLTARVRESLLSRG